MTKRLFVALLGVLLARYALAFEPFVIRDIRIEGIQRVEAGTVFGYLPVKVGETMSEDKAAQAIRALFATGLFKDVRVEVEGEVLVVVVEERPAIAQIDFVGMKDLPADQVRKALRENGIAEGRTFDKAVVDQAEQEIERQYLSRGRYGVTVTTTVTPLDRNRVAINFSVDDGEVAPINNRNIYLTTTTTEGEKYPVTDVKLGGDLLVPEAELMRLVQVKPGEPFSREKLAESTKAISERLGNDGYAFANANAVPDVNKEKRTVAFTIMIDPGRRVYVRRINIVGNTKTRDEVVRRELRQLEGGYYDGQKLQVSRQRVDKLNYFDSVELETEPVAGSSDQVDINLKVKEKATGSLLFGVGFSSSDGVMLQGSLSQANIFGSGNSVTVSANTGKVNRNIGFSYVNPYFTVDGVSAGFNVYDRRFDAEALDVGNYVTETYGGGVQFGFPTAEFDRVAAALAWEQTKIDLFSDSPPRFVHFFHQPSPHP